MNPWIRVLITRDMPEVLKIENTSFEYPWSESEFVRRRKRRGCLALVAEYQELIVGYVICETHRNSIYLESIAIHPDYRRQRVGSQILERIIDKLSATRPCLTTDVRETNLEAQLFFSKVGLKAVKIQPKFFDNGEDAYAFVYTKAN